MMGSHDNDSYRAQSGNGCSSSKGCPSPTKGLPGDRGDMGAWRIWRTSINGPEPSHRQVLN